MSVEGVGNDRNPQPDRGRYIEDQWRDPRFTSLRGPVVDRSAKEAPLDAKDLLGDDSLALTPEQAADPFEALIRYRQRRRKKKRDGDPTALE